MLLLVNRRLLIRLVINDLRSLAILILLFNVVGTIEFRGSCSGLVLIKVRNFYIFKDTTTVIWINLVLVDIFAPPLWTLDAEQK
jgi:hypothetical protein